MNQFGEKVKGLREALGLLQRNLAYELQIDTPMLSKIERGERRAKKNHIPIFARILQIKEDDLLALWLADQIAEILTGEKAALKAIDLAETQIKSERLKGK